MGLVHGLDHVVDQAGQAAVDVGDLGGALGQHRVAEDAGSGRQPRHHGTGSVWSPMSPGHYFDADPAVPSRPAEVELSLPDFRARLPSTGACSRPAAVDPGTVELLRASPAPPGTGDLLDLGCGYGPIACTLAHRAPGRRGVGRRRQRPGPRP